MISLLSVNGPSVTLILPRSSLTRWPSDVPLSPAVSMSFPLFKFAPTNSPIASRRPAGISLFRSSSECLMNIMYRIVVSPRSRRDGRGVRAGSRRPRETLHRGGARHPLAERDDARPTVGDVAHDRAHDRREQRRRDAHAGGGEYGRADHDDEQAQGGERRQARLDPEEAGQDQAQGAGDLADADEADEGDGEGDRALHLVGRHDELHGAGEGEEECDDDLSGPQQAVGGSLVARSHWKVLRPDWWVVWAGCDAESVGLSCLSIQASNDRQPDRHGRRIFFGGPGLDPDGPD